MTDEQKQQPNANEAGAQENKRQFVLQRVYLIDASFESPRAPEVFQGEWKPEMSVSISNRARSLNEYAHEVVLTVRVEAKQDGETAFLVEVQQAGVFAIAGFNVDEGDRVIGILCPQTLFPYARETISSMTLKGGFPQVVLQPIAFERLYEQNMREKQAGGQAQA